MRKRPVQQRSREMVEALLEAAELEIGERGLDATTTNHIAARAGVSVGSLYQYFESLDAILEAVAARHALRLLSAVDARMRGLKNADATTIIRRILKTVFTVVEENPAQREMVRHWQRIRTRAAFRALEERMFEHCRVYLLRHQDQYRVDDLPATLFVAVSSIQYTVAHYLLDPSPVLSQRQVIDALAAMVTAYLEHGAARPPRAARGS